MLAKIQNISLSHPFEAWVMSVLFLLASNLTLYFLVPGNHAPPLFLLFFGMSVTAPTVSIAIRFSDSELRSRPVSPTQHDRIGRISLLLADTGCVAMSCALLGKRIGLHLPSIATEYCTVVYALSTTIALGLGYAGRLSRSGRVGLRLTGGFFILLAGALLILSLIAMQKHRTLSGVGLMSATEY